MPGSNPPWDPFLVHVNLEQLMQTLVPHFSHLSNKVISTYFMGLLWGSTELTQANFFCFTSGETEIQSEILGHGHKTSEC